MTEIDLFVIGGGSGGVRGARMAAQRGARVVLAENSRLGGTCVNLGCVPKKLMSYASSYGHDIEDAVGYGWTLPAGAALEFDWARMRDNKDAEIKRLNNIYADNLTKAGVEIVKDRARLTGPNRVIAGDKEYNAKNILIATGSKPQVPDTPGLAEHAFVSDDIFSLPKLPERAIVSGAGYIAVEFACILAGMGVRTTLVHRGPTVLKNFDISIQELLIAEMRRQGIELRLDSPLSKLSKTNTGLLAQFAQGEPLEADIFLSATGRSPNVEGLGLEESGVVIGKRGELPVDENYQSNVPCVMAVGDVIGKVALTPVAIAEAMYCVAQRFGGFAPPVDYDLIPTAVFTHPNISTVGLTEAKARELYPDCECCVSTFRPMRHSLTGRGEQSMVKLIFEAGGGKVLGAHMVGPDAGELMQGIAVAVAKKATKLDFDATIGIHPTSAEEFVSMR